MVYNVLFRWFNLMINLSKQAARDKEHRDCAFIVGKDRYVLLSFSCRFFFFGEKKKSY